MDTVLIQTFINNYKEVYGADSNICEIEMHLLNNGQKPDIKHICEVCNCYKHKFGFDDCLNEVIDVYDLDIDSNTLQITKGE